MKQTWSSNGDRQYSSSRITNPISHARDYIMKISVFSSDIRDTEDALRQCISKSTSIEQNEINFVMVQVSALHDIELVRDVVSASFPNAAVHGATSCEGVLSSDGAMVNDGFGLALFAIQSEAGAFGSASIPFGLLSPKAAAQTGIEAALLNAGRSGQVPDLVWLSCCPGSEEQVILGVKEVIGDGSQIIGGTCADNDIDGSWSVFDRKCTVSSGLAISVLFCSVSVGTSFECTYEPTHHTGQATSANGRILSEIDGVSAKEAYNMWTSGLLDTLPCNESRNVLSISSLSPLGRKIGDVGGIDYFVLSHPETVTNRGEISLFTDIYEGDEVTLMTGTPDMLVSRAGKVVQSAKKMSELENLDISGAIIVYCAGCMLTVKERVQEINENIKRELGTSPFIGAFTFGEQGRFPNGSIRHGNLMVSAVIFGS